MVAVPSTAHSMTCHQSCGHGELRPAQCHTVTLSCRHPAQQEVDQLALQPSVLEQQLPLLESHKSFSSALLSSQPCLSLQKLSCTAPRFSILRLHFQASLPVLIMLINAGSGAGKSILRIAQYLKQGPVKLSLSKLRQGCELERALV